MKRLQEIWRRLKMYLFNKGIWRKRITFWETVSLIVGSTIGAGLLGIPYAVANVGYWVGVFYIVTIGILIVGVNLLLGEVSARTSGDLQLVGLSEKYLGKKGKWSMMVLFYVEVLAILSIYIIGEGQILASMFGGASFWWSVVFWFLASFCVYFGIEAVKRVETILTMAIVLTILIIAIIGLPHVNTTFYGAGNLKSFFLPYGVVLFSLSGISTIPSAYQVLKRKDALFKKSIIMSSLVSVTVYLIFLTVVIGVTGKATTEIATLGLGEVLGPVMFYVANIFALLAMVTSFIMLAQSMRDSLQWDFRFSPKGASMFALGVPILMFVAGMRSFVGTIDLVGGVIMSLQMFLIVFIYWKAKTMGDLEPKGYKLRHTLLIAMFTLLAFSFGAAYSVYGFLF